MPSEHLFLYLFSEMYCLKFEWQDLFFIFMYFVYFEKPEEKDK